MLPLKILILRKILKHFRVATSFDKLCTYVCMNTIERVWFTFIANVKKCIKWDVDVFFFQI